MNTNIHFDATTMSGTIGGTSLVLWINLGAGEVLKTIVLGIIGAVVSFTVSLLMKWIFERINKK